jgi:hypothetical protein
MKGRNAEGAGRREEGRRKNYEGEGAWSEQLRRQKNCGMRNGTSEGTKCQRLRGLVALAETDLRSRRRGRTLQQTARGDCDGQTLATPSKIKPAAVAGFAKLSDDILKRHLGGGLTIDSDDLVTRLERCFRSW